jgi:hypothetical protein
MVMPCCTHCYEKYINEDGTPDQEAIEKLEAKDVQDLKEHILKTVNDPDYDARKPLPRWQPVRCTCICHTKGLVIQH